VLKRFFVSGAFLTFIDNPAFLTVRLIVQKYCQKLGTVTMPKLAIPLTDIQVKNAKPKDKLYRLTDGGGLYLLINPDGAKYWRMD